MELEKIKLAGNARVQEIMSAFMADVGSESISQRFPLGQTPKEIHLAMEKTLADYKNTGADRVPNSDAPSIAEMIKTLPSGSHTDDGRV